MADVTGFQIVQSHSNLIVHFATENFTLIDPSTMPPKKDKKKGKQKQDDYWDNDFQQDAAAIETTTPAAPAADVSEPQESGVKTADAPEDPAMNDLAEEFGGLMAAIKKSKGKKGKKQQPVETFDANEELEAMDDVAPTSTQNGDGAAEKEDEREEEEEEEETGGEFRVKTKKEKEKEKKEKEKAKKKAQVTVNSVHQY
jgi:translation initiation factor 5B